MAEFLNFIFNFLLCYGLMRLALAFFNLNQEAKNAQRQEFKDYLEKVVHAVKEEKHGDQIYWFDQDKDSFITQGKTRADIVENLKKDYHNHIFILDDVYILCAPDWIPIANKPINLNLVDK